MNEPHRGYIDLPSLHEFDYNTDLHLSHVRACSWHRFPPFHTHPRFQHLLFSRLCSRPAIRLPLDSGLARSLSQPGVAHIMS